MPINSHLFFPFDNMINDPLDITSLNNNNNNKLVIEGNFTFQKTWIYFIDEVIYNLSINLYLLNYS